MIGALIEKILKGKYDGLIDQLCQQNEIDF